MVDRQYSAARFALEIEGTAVGFAASAGGGEAFAQVISITAPSGVVEKQPGQAEFEPLVLEVDTSLGAAFYDRITGFLDGSQKPMSGAVRLLDHALTEQLRLEWTNGLISEVAFPAADGGSREAGHLRVTIQPESTRRRAGSGTKVAVGASSSHPKRWLPSNFRFSISGLENPTRRVNKVESLVIRRSVTAGPGGLVAGALEVPDVIFTVAASEGTPFYDWFEDFVVKGNNTAGDERTGSLVFLDPSLQDQLIGIAMQGLGILRVSEERATQGSSAIARVKVQLYCEAMTLAPAPAQPAAPGTSPSGAPGTGTQPTESAFTAEIAAALRDAIRFVVETDRASSGPLTEAETVRGDAVAERLLSTIRPTPDARERPASTDLRSDRGRDLGTRWASTTATLDELVQIAELGAAEWSALVLRDGHSLIGFLARQGELREGERGPVELARDAFTEGLVAGAADVQRQAAPHLEGRLEGRDVLGRG